MRARLCILLVCALLVPTAGGASVVVNGLVKRTVKANPDPEKDFEPARGALVQYVCPRPGGDVADQKEADQDGRIGPFPVPTGPCKFRVVLPGELPSTVLSIYFEDVEESYLRLFLERREKAWYLHGYVE